MTAIEWTDATWNPTTGCSKVSAGCDHCYAETLSLRFGWSKLPWSPENAEENVVLRPERLRKPLSWREPRMVFVNSMSDLFHTDVPESYIADVFSVMEQCPQHTFQVLTKRAERLARLAPRLPWPKNVWMGVSVESLEFLWRVDYLRKVDAAVRFVSAEPLLASLKGIDLSDIHWLIAGGESQPGCRPASLVWFRELRDACKAQGAAYFLKQLGGHPSKRGGSDAKLDHRLWHEMPTTKGRAGQTVRSLRSSRRTPRPSGASQRGAVDIV